MNMPIRVLVLEDKQLHYEALVSELRLGGLAVESRHAASGGEFTRALAESWDIVLADFVLPGFTALDALRTLKEREIDTPLIVVSGTIDEESALTVYQGGARDFVTKERLARLVPAVVRELEEADTRRERLRVERELENSIRRFELTLRQLPGIFWTTGVDLRIESAFGGAFASLARPASEYIGVAVEGPDSPFPPVVGEAHRRALAGQASRYELAYEGRVYDAFVQPIHGESGVTGVVGVSLDVTEQRHAEAEARRAEREFETLVENSDDLILRVDRELRLLYVNAATEQAVGRNRHDVLGRQMDEYLSPQSPALLREMVRQIEESGEGRTFEFEHSGHVFQARITPEFGDEEIESLLFVARDVTSLVEKDRELRTSEAHYRALVEATLDVFSIVAADGTLRYAAPSVVSTIGYAADERVGRSIFEHIHPEDRDGVETAFARCVAQPGMIARLDYRYRRRDGVWRHLSTLIRNLLDDELVQGVVASTRDVTEQREREARLRESEKHFRSLFDMAVDAIVLADDQGRWIDANPAMERLVGLSHDELLGMSPADIVDEAARDSISTAWSTFLQEGSMTGQFELVRPDGERRFVDFAAKANFVPGRHLSIIRDVSERRRLEEQLVQAQKMEAVGRLAGGVAHDFNNLLLVIRGYGDLLAGRFADDRQASADIRELLDAADRAASLTEQLLAFSRRQVVQPVTIYPNEVVDAMRKMIGRLIGEDIAMVTELAERTPPVCIDRGQLEQIVINLAVNARDAMPHGGVLRIETAGVSPSDSVLASRGLHGREFLRLRVGDNGLGMDAETLDRAFEPFFTTKPPGLGTGLGLSTVYGLVQSAGGFVEAHSVVGRGTTFDVYLPAAEGGDGFADDDEEESPPTLLGTETILLVEDEAKVRSLVEQMLSSFGYSVVASENARAAVDLAQTLPVDLLLTDVVMPELGGDDVAALVRRARPDTRVLFMSGYPDRVAGRKIDVEGNFIKKPFSRDELARKVREVLDR